jgi:hypothetical protein
LSRDGFYKDLYDKQGQLDEAEANSDLKET